MHELPFCSTIGFEPRPQKPNPPQESTKTVIKKKLRKCKNTFMFYYTKNKNNSIFEKQL